MLEDITAILVVMCFNTASGNESIAIINWKGDINTLNVSIPQAVMSLLQCKNSVRGSDARHVSIPQAVMSLLQFEKGKIKFF